MAVPLAFRALARGVANSPLSGLGYQWLILGDEEIRVRAPVQRTESVTTIDGLDRIGVMHWAVVQEADVLRSRARVVQSGDKLRDDEGKVWQIRDAFRNGAAQWRVDLIADQDTPKPVASPEGRPRRPRPR